MNTMWCTHCQQDVPGIVSREDDHFRCPRCGRGLPRGASCSHGPSGWSDSPQPSHAPDLKDVWELNEQLEHIERVLQAENRGGPSTDSLSRKPMARLDPAHRGAAPCHLITGSNRSSTRQAAPEKAGAPFLSAVTWAALSLGTATFVCGGVLLAWSLVADRAELWTFGVPIALGGQVALLIGLILQLDRIWTDNRQSAAKLEEVDDRLDDLRSATTMLRSHGSSGTAFYSHMASGASPQLLLSDLKGQLDLLATRINQAHSNSPSRQSD